MLIVPDILFDPAAYFTKTQTDITDEKLNLSDN